MWTNDYDQLLAEWAALREQGKDLPLKETLILVNDWWWQSPIINPYLHIADPEDWPSPWDLLAEKGFCDLAKSLGMCYTLLLMRHKEINSLRIVQTDNYTLVLVNDQYVLNEQLGDVTADLTDIRIVHSVDGQVLKNKLKI